MLTDLSEEALPIIRKLLLTTTDVSISLMNGFMQTHSLALMALQPNQSDKKYRNETIPRFQD